MIRRANAFVDSGGEHFEHFLWFQTWQTVTNHQLLSFMSVVNKMLQR
jgi:hypothetical protein